jgi:uncharacterized protein (DUF305 family)
MSPRARILAAGLLGVLIGAVALGSGLALAGGDDGSVGGQGPFMGMSDARASYDLRFIDEMTMHHRGAVMSARMMIGDSRRPELRGLARRITADQERQIEQMAAWRRQWYRTAGAPATGMHGGMGKMGGMERMPGDASDRMFLRMMIPHHALAVHMGKDAVGNASHPELKRLAQEIVEGQTREIAEMEGYLERWYGGGSTRGAAEPMEAMMRQMMSGGK